MTLSKQIVDLFEKNNMEVIRVGKILKSWEIAVYAYSPITKNVMCYMLNLNGISDDALLERPDYLPTPII